MTTTSDKSAEDPSTTWSRLDLALLAGLVALALVSLTWTLHGHYDARNDSSLYLLVTRALLEGEGLTYLGEPFVIRPPGFALLLAPVLAAAGTDPLVLNAFVSLWGVALVALLFVLLRPRTGGPLAAAAGALVWFAPGMRELCNQVMSDVPGVTLLLAALVLERRTRQAGPGANLALGLFVGAAALVRTMDVLLVPAIVGSRVIDAAVRRRGLPRERRLWLGVGALALGAALPVAPWTLSSAGDAPEGRTLQTHIHSYTTAQWHVDPADPGSERVSWGAFLGRAEERVPQALASIGSGLATDEGGAPLQVLGGLGLAAALVVFLRRRDPGALFVLGAMVVVGTYFAFKPRLVLPLFVLCVAAATELVALAAGDRARLRSALAGLLTLGSLLLPGGPDVERIEKRDGMRRTITERLLELTPEGAVLAASTGWDLGVYLPERRVISLRFAFKQGRARAVLRELEEHDVELLALFEPWAEDNAILTGLGRVAPADFELVENYRGWVLLRRR